VATVTAAPSAAEALARRRQSPAQRVQHLLHSHPAISPAVILVLSVAVFTALEPSFGRPANLSILVQQTAVVGALAVGQTLVILTAGSLNGLLVTRLNLPPFIVTLGTLSIFTAIALLYSGGSSIQGTQLPALLNWTGTDISLGAFDITTGVLVVLAIYLVVGFALSQTGWGRHVYAVGDDAEASRLAGIRVNRVLFSVYAVAGVIYGLAGWVLIGRAGSATPNGITDGNLQSITAVVIGGTSLFGGRGAVVGSLIGALIVQVFDNGLALSGVDPNYQVLAVGVLVIVAVAADQWIRSVKS
jgi:fructose transport system permease protein